MSWRWLHLLIGAAALAAVAPARALDPNERFHHYDVDRWDLADGLPLATITAITQDPAGYLWVGTQNGLARFDGARFTVFKRESHPGLGGNHVNALEIDRAGRLWIATTNGVAWYARGRFHAVTGEDPLGGSAHALAELPDGAMLVGTDTGLMRAEPGRLTAFSEREPARRPVRALLRDRRTVWAGVAGAVLEIRGNDVAMHRFDSGRAGAPPPVTALARHHDALWVGTPQGLWRHADGRFAPLAALAGRPVEALREDREKNLWVASNAGLYRVRESALVERVEDETVLNNLYNRALFEDRDGHLWIGAQAGGLVRVWDGRAKLYGAKDGLGPPAITWAVATAQDGGIWIGTADGVSLLRQGRITRAIPGSALHGPVVPALLEDSKRRLWIGSTSGLDVWRNGRPLALPGLGELPAGRYLGLAEDRDGAIWIGAQHGVYRWTEAGGFELQAELRDARVRYLAGIDGAIWAATELGVHRRAEAGFVPVDAELGLPARHALAVLAGGADRVWLGYLDQGLVLWTAQGIRRYTAEQGLPSNTVLLPIETSDGWLWLSTLQGVARVPVADFARLDRGEIGRLGVEFVITAGEARRSSAQNMLCCHGGSNGAGLVTQDGLLLLPNVNGVIAVDLHARGAGSAPPPAPIVERLVTPRGDYHDLMEPLELAPAERDLSFEFTAIDLGDPTGVHFDYMLEGYDEEWIEAGERRLAIYTNLDPGGYVLRVRARDAVGTVSTGETRFEFAIQPYPTETPLFYLLAAFSLGALGYGAHRLVSWQLYRQRQLLEATVARRTIELSALNDKLADANRRLEEMTLTDELTGVRNRRFIDFQISKEIAQLERLNEKSEHKQALMFLFVDLDHFKRVNDTHGHLVGDSVLRELARLLVRCSRTGDHVVRMGGEEFMMVLHGVERATAIQVARRLRQVIREHAFPIGEGRSIRVTASLGFAFYPFVLDQPELLSVEDAMTLADRALYFVKQNGRDSWAGVFSLPKMSEATLRDSLNQDPSVLAERGLIELVTPLRQKV